MSCVAVRYTLSERGEKGLRLLEMGLSFCYSYYEGCTALVNISTWFYEGFGGAYGFGAFFGGYVSGFTGIRCAGGVGSDGNTID